MAPSSPAPPTLLRSAPARGGTPVRFIVKVGTSCNNACRFCHSAALAGLGDLSTDEVVRRVERVRELGGSSVLFSGGEPTIRSDIVELAKAAVSRGLSFGLITNGRMLAYRPLREELLGLGMDYVYLSLHGPRGIHDDLTRVPGSFGQTLAAVNGLTAGRCLLTANAVVTARNLTAVGEVVRLLAPFSAWRIKFSYVEPKGRAGEDPDLVPRPVAAAAAVSRALDAGLARGLPLSRFAVDGFPHCLDARFGALQDDLFTHHVLGLREVNEEDFFPIDYGNMHKSGACLGCLLGDPCRGTFAAAFARFGEGWLRPVPGGRPNSFNYFPAGDAATGHEPGPREIVVAEGERGTLVATDTGDFSDQEILRTRDETQQVYQQVDDQPFLTDFGRQLRKLLPAGRPGWRTPADRDCFLPAEEAVGRVLERLSGRVLDVGCGQPRYAALLERKLAAGEIAYVGVDPHLPADAKLQPGGGALLALPCAEELARVRPGELRWVRAGIEGLAVPPGAFDWVLVLRSYNHLLDLWSAGRGILRALRWGGCLLVVDNVPFGVVRSRVDRGTIEAIPRGAGMEHLRTHGAAEAEAFLARFPLRVEQRSEVGPDTSNQWVLLYRKLWPAGLPGRDAY